MNKINFTETETEFDIIITAANNYNNIIYDES